MTRLNSSLVLLTCLAAAFTSALSAPPIQKIEHELELSTELQPNSKTIRITLRNVSNEDRFIWEPIGGGSVWIVLTQADGTPVAMTPEGKSRIYGGGGSVKNVRLQTGGVWSRQFALDRLFKLPADVEVKCVATRTVYFSGPEVEPPVKQRIEFPAILLPSGMPAK